MDTIHTGFTWLDKLMPDGIHTHTSILISGPGGSGKPLLGNAFATAWLEQGGSVVFMSLQYPSTDFIFSGIAALGRIDLHDYLDHALFIVLDPTIDGVKPVADRKMPANVVKPAVWKAAIEQACSLVPNEGPGILVFGSALNLLLFSPTYGEAILEEMERTIRDDKRRTYLFSISTSAKQKEAARLEAAADNLFMTHSTQKPVFQLFLRIVRLKDARFSPEEIQVPIPPQALSEVREVAEHSRSRVIPLVSKL